MQRRDYTPGWAAGMLLEDKLLRFYKNTLPGMELSFRNSGRKVAATLKKETMKQLAFFIIAVSFLACNNSTTEAERPRDPNEGITNSTRIVGDSVIVPDTNNLGVDPSGNDTSKSKMN